MAASGLLETKDKEDVSFQEITQEDILTVEEMKAQIARYEKDFGMSSEEFLQQMKNGTAPDTFEAMDWMALLRFLSQVS